VVSVDGHAISGEVTFTVDGPADGTGDGPVGGDGASEPPTATESQAAGPTPTESTESAPWYTRTSWLVVGIGALLCAVLASLLRRRRHV
jgi:hypothetical protein